MRTFIATVPQGDASVPTLPAFHSQEPLQPPQVPQGDASVPTLPYTTPAPTRLLAGGSGGVI